MTTNLTLPQAVKDQIAWQIELATLEAEQARDLAEPCLSWWQPPQLSVAEYYDMPASRHGKTEVCCD